MIKLKSTVFASFLILLISFRLSGQTLILKQKNSSGIYSRRENVEYYLLTDSIGIDSVNITVVKNNNDEVVSKTVRIISDSTCVYAGSFDGPCSVMVQARYSQKEITLGSVVDPEMFRPGAPAPKDFKAYWKQQRKILRALQWEVKAVPVRNESIPEGYTCEDIEINCPGPKTAKGYYVKPSDSKNRSLPAVLLVHAAGVSGSWCKSKPENAMKYAGVGAICLDLNAHGMLNGQPDGYYEQLEKNELKGYWMQGVASRDDYYFRGMYLRLMRAIEFLARQPEWDGKRILVMGESQGGGQSLAAAGLDERVTAVVALVPAMCDWLGPISGRMGGWPQPYDKSNEKDKLLNSIPYFDAANLINGSKATFFVEIGLVDNVCPATSVYAALNQVKGKKYIYPVPYRNHYQPVPPMESIWIETVFKPREAFIKDFLK